MSNEAELGTLSEGDFGRFLKLIHDLTGITIHAHRKSMVEGRLRRCVRQAGVADYAAYFDLVQGSPRERENFIDAITTNETSFFRTARVWDYIEKKVLPNWQQHAQGRTFEIWSAAASSGEEAHSLGILCQAFKDKNPQFSYRIFGTDISGEMVERCQKGVYKGRSLEGFRALRPDLFSKYMREGADGFTATPEIRSRLKFARHNLFESPRWTEKFDLILLRNVLIYFTPPDQQAVLARAHEQLAGHGTLIIGESESLSHLQTEFNPVEPLIYQKKSVRPAGAAA